MRKIRKDVVGTYNVGLTELFIIFLGSLEVAFIILLLTQQSGDQWNVFAGRGNNFLADYFNVLNKSRNLDPYLYGQGVTDGERAYPALPYLIFYVASRMGFTLKMEESWWSYSSIELMVCIVFIFTCTITLLEILTQIQPSPLIKKWLKTIVILFSGAMLFSLERGNIILLAAIGTTGYVCLYDSEDKRKRYLAFFLLSLAAAIKVYPAILGILTLQQKRWKETIHFVIIGMATAILPFFFLNGGLKNLPQLMENLKASSDYYEKVGGERFSYPCYAPYFLDISVEWWGNFKKVCKSLVYLGTALSIALSMVETSRWRKISLLMFIVVMLPVNSSKYGTLYLLVCLMLFLAEEKINAINIIYLVLFVLMLQPLQCSFYWGNWWISLNTIVFNLSSTAIWVLLLIQGTCKAWKSKSMHYKRLAR